MPYHFRENRGFTLVELLVSISIVIIILTVIVLNQSTYTEGAALTNLVDDIGLRITQAQAYGIGVKELAPGTEEFNASYGLTFSLLSGSSGSNLAYLSFADRGTPTGNKVYDGDWSCPIGGTSECLEKVTISRGNHIDAICAVISSGADQCNIGRVDISFDRPDTEAQIFFSDAGGNLLNPPGAIGTRIRFKSPRGLTRSVVVYKTGQTSVQ